MFVSVTVCRKLSNRRGRVAKEERLLTRHRTDSSESPITVRSRRIDLELRHTFRLARGAFDSRRNLVVELEQDGLVGLGEAAPIARYAQDWRSAAEAVDEMAARLGQLSQVSQLDAFRDAVPGVAVTGQPAGQAALDMAVWDLAGKRLGAPIWRLLGLDRDRVPPTSFTLGLDDPATMVRKVGEVSGFRSLKVKLGGPDDRAAIEAVRSVSDLPLRVDANEGWTLKEARANIQWLAELGVELVEQPLPAEDLAGSKELRRSSPLPIFADESVSVAADIPRIAESFDGINIKLMKCGSLGEALRMIATARAHGLKIMLGCMVESSLAITAAAQLSPLVDHADLDGCFLVSNDPFVGARLVGGCLRPPDGPGLGVTPC